MKDNLVKDTIICSASEEAFELLFKKHGMWASVYIAKYIQESNKLEYCAMYRKKGEKGEGAVTHYAKIAGIIEIPKGTENGGKCIIFFEPKSQDSFNPPILRGKTKGVQGRIYTSFDKLDGAGTLDKLPVFKSLK